MNTEYLPRSEFECRRKVRYATQAEATAAEQQARRRGQTWLHTYRCRYCDGYHVGHVTNWKGLARRAREEGRTG
jgi:hypothetical protein